MSSSPSSRQKPKYVWVAAPGSTRLPPVPRRIPAVYPSTPAALGSSSTPDIGSQPSTFRSSNEDLTNDDAKEPGSSSPQAHDGWDSEGIFYVAIPLPADREARTQVVRTLVTKLMTLPTRHEFLRFALYRVTTRFLADFGGIWSRDPDTGVVDRSQPASLDAVFYAWKSEVARALEAHQGAWRGIHNEMKTIAKDVYRALEAERNGEGATERGPEEVFKKGFRLRALAGIPTRVPVEYGSDGRLQWCGYIFEELSMSSLTYEVISGCLEDVCQELGYETSPPLDPAPRHGGD